MCESIQAFGQEVLAPIGQWLKIAAEDKARVLIDAVTSAPAELPTLEIGTYCGYSALLLALARPCSRVVTVEADPAHVVIARNVIAFAGLAGRIDVLTGHSEDVIPKLKGWQQSAVLQFGSVFMDQRGSRYDLDLSALEQLELLAPGAVIVADNVLKPGAPTFLWRVTQAHSGYTATIVPVREFAMPSEDWMAVCVREKLDASVHAASTTLPPPPRTLRILEWEAERMRVRAYGSEGGSVRFQEWAAFAEWMCERLLCLGVGPDIARTNEAKP